MKKGTREQITRYDKELHLPMFRQYFEGHAKQAARQSLSYEGYLLGLMEAEYHNRMENRKKNYIRQAGFPQRHYLHELDKMELPPWQQKSYLNWKGSIFYRKEGRNIVLAGNHGTGKTHIATALGIRACQEAYKVLFVTMDLQQKYGQLDKSHDTF